MQKVNGVPVSVKVKKMTHFTGLVPEREDAPCVCLNETGGIQLRETFDMIEISEGKDGSEEECAVLDISRFYERLTGVSSAPVELSTTGLLTVSEQGVTLMYEEYVFDSDRTAYKEEIVLTVDSSGVAIIVCSFGNQIRDFLVFEKGKQHMLPAFQSRAVSVFTRTMEYVFREKEGYFHVEYTVDIGGSMAERKEMMIEIQ
ncbi:MAG TPA: hypothetical protein DCY75_11165 [Clostridiales bacterium]|nr:hypothetical protein [Clostridiales bacterium]